MTQHSDLQTSTVGINDDDPIIYESGQRRCGPPRNWIGETPAKGCEVFIAKIPKECFEKDLISVMKQSGDIYLFRLMMENDNCHRGFGFCVYTSIEAAKDAVLRLNNYQIRKNWFLGICFSVDNCRLFVGGIPKLKIKSEIFKEMSKVTDNVVDIIVYPSAADKSKNRGFAFVEYTDHKSAAVARKKMIGNGIQLWGHTVAVDWAEPERKVDEETMSKVKILYVRNLMLTTSEETIYQNFSKYTNDGDEIIRVKKIGDFAFVHFKNRDQAEIVRNNLNGAELEGSVLEVHFAKPANKLEQQQKLIKKTNSSINHMLPMALSNEMAKLSVDSDLTAVVSPTGVDNNGMFKTYRNAAGRCSMKSKQMIKNVDESNEIYFSNFAEILAFICQNQGWDVPYFTVQMIPMMLPHNDVTIQVFIAQAYIQGLNINFPSKVCGFTQDEAIMSACDSALEYLFYNGVQIPSPLGQSNIKDLFTNDMNEKNFLDNNPSWTTLNYGNQPDFRFDINTPGKHSQQFVPQIFQYNPLAPYYSSQNMQLENCHPLLDSTNFKDSDSDKMSQKYTVNQTRD